MIVRLAAAGVGLAVLLPAILFGGVIAVDIIVAIAAVVCLDEYAGMAFPTDRWVAFGWLTLGVGSVFAAAWLAGFAAAAVVGVIVIMATMAFVTIRPGETLEGASDRVGRYLLGIGWIGGMMAFLPLLRRLDHGVVWVFLVLVIPWAGDTGAYFAGRAFGRRKLAPRVSPKKTWEGFFGGITMAVVGVFIVRAVGETNLEVLDCLLLGTTLGGAAVIGDLSESLLKRSFDVKDSGWIMPGHGGLLDRVDSLMFVAPLLYAYAVTVGS